MRVEVSIGDERFSLREDCRYGAHAAMTTSSMADGFTINHASDLADSWRRAIQSFMLVN